MGNMRAWILFIGLAIAACGSTSEPLLDTDVASGHADDPIVRDESSAANSELAVRRSARQSATGGDTRPPTAPRNLRVTAKTPNTISLTWDPSTDDSGSVIYVIRLDGGGYPFVIDWYRDTSITLSGLDAGTPFTITVTARDESRNFSAPSNTVIVTTDPRDTEAPTAPSGLRVTGITQTSVSLAWEPSTDNVAVVTYWIHLDGVIVRGTGETSFTFTGLTPATTYQFAVSAEDGGFPSSNRSSPSNTVTATTGR